MSDASWNYCDGGKAKSSRGHRYAYNHFFEACAFLDGYRRRHDMKELPISVSFALCHLI